MSTYTTGSKESVNHLVLAFGSTSQHTSTQPNIGSRTVTSDLLSSTTWLKGPAFLYDASLHSSELQEAYDLIDPDADSEVRPKVVASFTHVTKDVIHPQRFERFSKFSALLTFM